MIVTSRLELPLLASGQAQKHVTHNEALMALDALIFLAVQSVGINTPPTAPAVDERHIVGTAPTGAWVGRAATVAVWQDGGWVFYTPRAGWLAFAPVSQELRVHDGNAWLMLASAAPLTMLGINTTANAINRLAVSSDASLFNHVGAGHQLKLNKAGSAATASLLFQSAYSGRAEIGLAGDDNLRINVSPDGTAWSSAVTVAGDGRIGINRAPTGARLSISGSDTTGTVGDLQIVRENYYALNFCEVYSSAAAVHAALFILRRARGTLASPQGVQVGDQIGGLAFRAFAPGGTFAQPIVIAASVTGTPSANAVPSDLIFSLGAAGATERVRITESGRVGIGTNAPTAPLHVAGAARIGSFTAATLPAAPATGSGGLAYVSDASGGATMAFCDGTNWRKLSDRSVVA